MEFTTFEGVSNDKNENFSPAFIAGPSQEQVRCNIQSMIKIQTSVQTAEQDPRPSRGRLRCLQLT